MKIGTYNIRVDMPIDWLRGHGWWFNRHRLVIKKIKDNDLDIIALQEVKHWFQLLSINLALHEYDSFSVGRNSDNGLIGERVGIWWKKNKYKLIVKNHFFISETPDQSSKGWDATYKKVCAVVMLQDILTGEYIHVFSTHLDSNGKVAKEKGMKLVLSKMDKINKRHTIFMLGDLNISPFIHPDYLIAPYYLALEKYNDCYKIANTINQIMPNTYNGFNSNIEPTEHYRGDMIFTNLNYVEQYSNEFDSQASDHNLIHIKTK